MQNGTNRYTDSIWFAFFGTTSFRSIQLENVCIVKRIGRFISNELAKPIDYTDRYLSVS